MSWMDGIQRFHGWNGAGYVLDGRYPAVPWMEWSRVRPRWDLEVSPHDTTLRWSGLAKAATSLPSIRQIIALE